MSWHYQIRKQITAGHTWFDIVEVYDNPRGWTENSIVPAGESPEGVIEALEHMLADAKKYPVLEDSHEP